VYPPTLSENAPPLVFPQVSRRMARRPRPAPRYLVLPLLDAGRATHAPTLDAIPSLDWLFDLDLEPIA
jgi:hypothetical protein